MKKILYTLYTAFKCFSPSEVNITISNIIEEIIRLHSSNLQLPVSLAFSMTFDILN